MRRCCSSCRSPFQMTSQLSTRRLQNKWKTSSRPWKSRSRLPLSTLFPLWPLLPQPRTQCTRVPMVRAQAVPSTSACQQEDHLDLLLDAIRDMTKDARTRPFFPPTPTARLSLARSPRLDPSTASGLRFSPSLSQSVSSFPRDGESQTGHVVTVCRVYSSKDSRSDSFSRCCSYRGQLCSLNSLYQDQERKHNVDAEHTRYSPTSGSGRARCSAYGRSVQSGMLQHGQSLGGFIRW